MTYAWLVSIAAVLSCVLTYLIWMFVDYRRIHDVPNLRSMHTGRLAIGAGWAIVTTALVLWPWWEPVSNTRQVVLVLAVILVLATLSWIDDLRSLPPLLRLIVHAGAVALLLFQIPSDVLAFGGGVPKLFDRFLCGICWLWFINLYNFMDGIDGITGTETAGIALGYAVLAAWVAQNSIGGGFPGYVGGLTNLALILTGAALGFLVWNWHPARIILGDVGSIPLGFLLGMLMLDLALRGHLAAALILPMHHVADATYTFVKRCLTVPEPWKPHRQHFYQRAVLGGRSVPQVVVRIALLDAVLIVFAVLSLRYPWPALCAALAATAMVLRHLSSRSAGETP